MNRTLTPISEGDLFGLQESVRRENFPCFTLFCEIFTNGIVDIKSRLLILNILS